MVKTLDKSTHTRTSFTTYTGKFFDLFQYTPDDIDIVDIAVSLSRQCRYNGHCKYFYSVAEHSILLSYAVPSDFALHALLHDAAKAYLGDVIAPVKELTHCASYRAHEHDLLAAIFEKFGVTKFCPSLSELDKRLLHNEREVLFPNDDCDWNIPGDPLNFSGKLGIYCYPPNRAQTVFLDRFQVLTRG